MAVLPEYQKRGIGSALLVELFAEARRRGAQSITLTTFEDIPWNAPLYRKFGFSVIPEESLSPELVTELENQRLAGMRNRVAMVCRF